MQQTDVYVVVKTLPGGNRVILRAFSRYQKAKDYSTIIFNRYKARRVEFDSIDIFETKLD